MHEVWWLGNILITTFEIYLFDDFISKILTFKNGRRKYRVFLYVAAGGILLFVNTFQSVPVDILCLVFIYFLLLSFLYKNTAFEKVFNSIGIVKNILVK